MTTVAAPPSTLAPGSNSVVPTSSAVAPDPTKTESSSSSDKDKQTVTTDKAPVKIEIARPQGGDSEDKPDSKSPSGGPTASSDDRGNPVSQRTTFDLEPNPFEQSFSRGSQSDRTTPPRGGEATSVKHNTLPPLSSLTSPAAADPSQFPWLAGHSLRSGPLSPAMLAGPAQASKPPTGQDAPANAANTWGSANNNGAGAENYESGSFRTGFTPGTGSGFTPGYNAILNSNFGNLPMPSPNTAAFLNSITNVGGGNVEGSNGEGINAAGSAPGSFNPENRPPASAIPPHLQPHGMSQLNPAHPSQQGQQQQQQQQDSAPSITPNTLNALTGAAVAATADLNRPAGAMGPGFYQPNMPPQAGGPGMGPGMPHVDYAQQNANAASQAANGLFLLSQAHQELSKREEEAKSSSGRGGGAGGKASAGTKRKETATAAKGGAAKKGKKATPEIKDESDSDMDLDKKDDKKSGRPETEEEKRKNFLERNRQAALKCRQRKKAWLQELQNKVETLSMENERLQQTVHTLDEEIARLSSILMQHRECGIGLPAMAPAYGRPLR